MKMLVATAVVVFAAVGVGANTASAANGQVEMGNGRSICRYSGLNDEPDSNVPLEGGRVQSFGQIVRQIGPEGVRFFFETVGVPGVQCNPNTGLDLHAEP